MSFKAVFLESFAEDLKDLDKNTKKIVEKRIAKIIENPFSEKPLHGEKRFWSSRILNLRIIYRIEQSTIYFLKAESRKNVYKKI